ncbi:MAG: AraC family transcriptional regulator [Planctomycetota bacterium]
MNPAYSERVHRVMDHVRSHLDGDLSLDALARVACFSPHHFHRIFSAAAGETLTRFVQRARLERAAYLMKASPERELGSIALEVGFSAQSDFSRVFRQRYGVAPSAWDRRSRLDEEGIEGYDATIAAVRTDWTPAVRVVERPACRLAYVRLRGAFHDGVLAGGLARLTAELEERGVDWRSSALVGLSWDNYETTPLDQVSFDLGLTVGPKVRAGGELGLHTFPAVRAAEVHSRGPLSHVAVAWDELYNVWLPGSQLEPVDLPAMKRFRPVPAEVGWETWDVDCSIAVRPMRP